MRPIVLVLVWLCVLIPGTASAATAAGVRPVLRLNTVMHTAGVRRIAVDAAGKLLASGAHHPSADR